MAGHIRQPQIVIGKMRPHAAARRGMPPMLHVAFPELPGGGAQQVLAGERRFGVHQRHRVLQLVAETIGSAGLIESRPPPEPAAQCLIEQPAVRHHVHRRDRAYPHSPRPASGSRYDQTPSSAMRHASARRKRWIMFTHLPHVPTDSETETWFHVPVRPADRRRPASRRMDPVPRRPCRKGARVSAPPAATGCRFCR